MKVQLGSILTVGLLLLFACVGCASPKPAPEPAAEPSPRVRELLVEYRDTLLAAEREGELSYQSGTMDHQALGELRLARLGAEFELAETRDERIQILTALFEAAKGQETLLQGRFDAELASNLELLQARALRIRAEIALEREKARKP